ncbi:hypothetical protein K474DRAFT_1685932 [Panus rudis PR-1116 ss-1]|nr:hypothetical protein K474DRAFT_1685932 [Panus rudis PR-1116 ss-1]
MEWLYSGSNQKSVHEADRLVNGVLMHDQFCLSELADFSVPREVSRLDATLNRASDTWRETTVFIPVPDGNQHRPGSTDYPIPKFPIPGLMHRPLIDIIRATWIDPTKTKGFHYTPFRQFWLDPSGRTQSIHDELYTTQAFNDAHLALQRAAPEPNCTLPRVICAMMLYSDSTHLTSFGDAAAWPIYLFFGNQSKYTRVQPTSNACVHVAYMPKVCHTGHGASADILTHCRRELFHAIWRLLLDSDFIHAYNHGIIIDCTDNVRRRVYPRIFTYSADYPEKVLLACLRLLGAHQRHPDTAYQSRTQAAYRAVYELGKGVKSVAVENALAEHSYMPTLNAFAVQPSNVAFDPFSFLTVDLLHEFELGVWKSVFTHLIRMLVAMGGEGIQKLNER